MTSGERFVMRTAEGPFPMETTYTWTDGAGGGTICDLVGVGKTAAEEMGDEGNHGADRHRLRGLPLNSFDVLWYHAVALSGSDAYAATSLRSLAISISVRMSTLMATA